VIMSTAGALSVALAAISAIQTILAMLSGALFDRIWNHFLSVEIEQDKDDELCMRNYFKDPGMGAMRTEVVVRLMRLAGGVVAALTTFLALVVASGALVVAALAVDQDEMAWIAVVLTLLSLVAFFGLLLLAVQRPVYDYRVGVAATSGWRGFVNRRHPTTLTFYRDAALVLSCLLIVLSTVMTL
jgi:hypothetical protein